MAYERVYFGYCCHCGTKVHASEGEYEGANWSFCSGCKRLRAHALSEGWPPGPCEGCGGPLKLFLPWMCPECGEDAGLSTMGAFD